MFCDLLLFTSKHCTFRLDEYAVNEGIGIAFLQTLSHFRQARAAALDLLTNWNSLSAFSRCFSSASGVGTLLHLMYRKKTAVCIDCGLLSSG